MDPMAEEQLDYGDEEYSGSQKSQFHGSGGAIPALADDDLMGEDDEYDDLYNDVNVGDGFMQTLQQRSEPPAPSGNSITQIQKLDVPGVTVVNTGISEGVSIPGVGIEKRDPRLSTHFPNLEQKMANEHLEKPTIFQGGPAAPARPKLAPNSTFAPRPAVMPSVPGSGGFQGRTTMQTNQIGLVGNHPGMNDNSVPVLRSFDNNVPTTLFVGDLHWWTTDADLENVLSQYGRVKEIKFFDERASGKSKGYCQVDFYDPAAAAACKEGMNGHMFNGRACVVTFASPQTLKQMGAGYMKRNQVPAQSQPQVRGMISDGPGRGGNMNHHGGDGGRNYGRAGWGRGGQGTNNRGQGGTRGRGAFGARGMAGGASGVGSVVVGGPYGQGFAGPGMGGPTGALMHPQNMMGAGYDPTFMARGAYSGFPAPAFPGLMPSFPVVNTVGLPGVAPHVNPAFFGRGMVANGMGMMISGAIDVHSAGMWADTGMGWTGEEQGRTRESSYGGDDVASEYGYGDATHERGGRSNASREKDRGSEHDWSGNSERRQNDEKEYNNREKSDRERNREEKDGNREQRHRGCDYKNEDDWDRGQSSSRSGSKSRMMQEDDHKSCSREGDYVKRRRE